MKPEDIPEPEDEKGAVVLNDAMGRPGSTNAPLAASERQQEVREAIAKLCYVLAASDSKKLFYGLSSLLAEQGGKSKAEFLDEQHAMMAGVARAKAAGLSMWGQLISGLAAVVATGNGTSADFLDTLSELLTDLDQGVRQGMRETVRAHLWPWPAPEANPQENGNISKEI